MLLNIHPAHRSTLHSIQLLAVAKSSDIRTYGIDAVFKPATLDLKILAEDVSCLCRGILAKSSKRFPIYILWHTLSTENCTGNVSETR